MSILASIMFAVTLTTTPATSDAAIQERPKNGDVVVINDFEYVLVSKSDWEKMWVMVCDLNGRLYKANQTESGRTMFHGKRGHTTVTNGTVQVEYEDGYIHTEQVKNIAGKSGRFTPKARTIEVKGVKVPVNVRPKGLDALRKRRREAGSVTNEVTVTREVGL